MGILHVSKKKNEKEIHNSKGLHLKAMLDTGGTRSKGQNIKTERSQPWWWPWSPPGPAPPPALPPAPPSAGQSGCPGSASRPTASPTPSCLRRTLSATVCPFFRARGLPLLVLVSPVSHRRLQLLIQDLGRAAGGKGLSFGAFHGNSTRFMSNKAYGQHSYFKKVIYE